MPDQLEHMQADAPVLGFNYNRLVDALMGNRTGVVSLTDSNGNPTVTGGQIQPPGLGAPGTVNPGTPTGLTAVAGLDNIAQANNAYLIVTWNPNLNADYVANYMLDYWNVSYLASGLTSGVAYTSLSLSSNTTKSAAPFAAATGTIITLDDGAGHTQNVTLSAPVKAGDTTIAITSFIANFSYPLTTTMVLWAHGSVGQATTSVKIHNLFAGYGYFLKLKAQNNLGNYSPNYATLYIAIPKKVTPPAVPVGLTAYSAPHGAFLQWTANTEPDLQGYLCQYSVDNGVTWIPINSGATLNTSMGWVNPASPTTATSNVPVKFNIAAVDWSGNVSAFSAPVAATTGGLNFAELLVGNLTALGTITGTGGIQTGTSGARMVVDAAGFRGYSTDGVKMGINYKNADGTLTLDGSLNALAISTATLTGPVVAGAYMKLDFTVPYMSVNDGTRDRVQVGKLPSTAYGITVLDATGAPIFDTQGLQQVMSTLGHGTAGTQTLGPAGGGFVDSNIVTIGFSLVRQTTVMVMATTNGSLKNSSSGIEPLGGNIYCDITPGIQGVWGSIPYAILSAAVHLDGQRIFSSVTTFTVQSLAAGSYTARLRWSPYQVGDQLDTQVSPSGASASEIYVFLLGK